MLQVGSIQEGFSISIIILINSAKFLWASRCFLIHKSWTHQAALATFIASIDERAIESCLLTKLLFTQHLKDCLKDDIINMYLNDQQFLAYWIQREEFLTFLPLLNTLWRSNLDNRSSCWVIDYQIFILSNWAWLASSFSPSNVTLSVWTASYLFSIV